MGTDNQRRDAAATALGLVFTGLLVLGFVVYMNSCSQRAGERAKQRQVQKEAGGTDLSEEAYYMSWEWVRDRCNAPGSAQFPDFQTATVVKIAPKEYTVRAYVDSQNSFGALLRADYTCTMVYAGDSKWTCRDLQLFQR